MLHQMQREKERNKKGALVPANVDSISPITLYAHKNLLTPIRHLSIGSILTGRYFAQSICI